MLRRFISVISDFWGVLSAILILVISFYLIVEEDGVEKFVKEIVPLISVQNLENH